MTTNLKPHALPDIAGPASLDRMKIGAERETIVLEYQRLITVEKLSSRKAAKKIGQPHVTVWRWARDYVTHGFSGLLDDFHLSGRKQKFPQLTETEETKIRELYRRSNKSEDAGSMVTAAKFFALEPDCREDLRGPILAAVEQGRVPTPLKRIFERITSTHIASHRQPGMTATENFSGEVGAFAQDLIQRRRVIESDDGTLNFAAWIPWPLGGDLCSDKFQVRLGRWQFLPALEAGFTQMYLGYALVCRPRGSYRAEDIRSLIHLIARTHGIPDKFRFERGAWESNAIVDLLKKLGVELDTVYQSNQKPFVEGGFSPLWTYLSMIDGQVGRYRGEMEEENLLVQKCRAGRADPRDHFPSLAQCIKAVDGALAMRNSDKRDSIYGKWVPEVRHQQLNEARPWRPLAAELEYLFSPYVKEWTVAKGTVGGKVQILEDYSAPFYFVHDDLWRWNGRKVRIYFDPVASPCRATIASLEEFHGYRKDEIICTAELIGDLPHFCRAAVGWSDIEYKKDPAWRKAALSALRRDLRALDGRGEIKSVISEQRDGDGGYSRIITGAAPAAALQVPDQSVSIRRGAALPASPEILQRRKNLLSRQADLARQAMSETP